ncbi:hypothetical protein PG991_012373 [Apiospora marii]|uniref:Uncharacterized protein n=1 Tax=Apiospora marii TaxID=335849 RepID=A0ABR1R9S3_9PEZI
MPAAPVSIAYPSLSWWLLTHPPTRSRARLRDAAPFPSSTRLITPGTSRRVARSWLDGSPACRRSSRVCTTEIGLLARPHSRRGFGILTNTRQKPIRLPCATATPIRPPIRPSRGGRQPWSCRRDESGLRPILTAGARPTEPSGDFSLYPLLLTSTAPALR